MRNLLVTGTLANLPGNGGNTLATLQFVWGLQRLGFRVLYFEQVPRDGCTDDRGVPCRFGVSVQRSYFALIMTAFSLADDCSLLCDGGEEFWGAPPQSVRHFAREADALVGLAGLPAMPDILGAVRKIVYVDGDPVYTQLWSEVYGVDLRLASADVLFTVGLNIGTPRCPIPTGGKRWHTLLPPIDLDFWSNGTRPPEEGKLTTVASWYGYAPLEYEGEWYGQKADEFRRFIELPSHVACPVEVALNIHPDDPDLALLRRHGWQVVDPAVATRDPWVYRSYVAQSRVEIGIAKNAYVKARSGWFSDRSAAYLAAGRPVLVQDTGLAEHLPLGTGLIPFRTLDELVAGAGELEVRYEEHCRAARALAERYFDAEKVLGKLVRESRIG